MQTIVMQEFLDHVLNGLGLSYTGKQIQKIENNYEAAYIIFDVDLFNRLGLNNRVSSAIFECVTPLFYRLPGIRDR